MGLTPDWADLNEGQQVDLGRIADGFISLTNHQAEGAQHLPAHLWAYSQEDFIRASLGMFVELGELVNECRWKPWRKYEGIPTEEERTRVLQEFGDVLHMLAWMLNNLRERFDIGPADIAAAFMMSHLENIERFKGNVPGREPPPAEEFDPSDGWRRLILSADSGGVRMVVLSKVASILAEDRMDGSPQDQEAAEMLRRFVNNEDRDAVIAWATRSEEEFRRVQKDLDS